MLKQQGTLYISFPIGRENSVLFNANRSFHPGEILQWANGLMELVRFDFVDDSGDLFQNWPLLEKNLRQLMVVAHIHFENYNVKISEEKLDGKY